MRRSLFGLLTVVATAGLLLVAGCEVFEQSNTLRVVSINNGNTLRSDIADFFVYFDPVDSEYIMIWQHMPDSVEVVLQYVEIGPGLPTWTPYVAHIKQVDISYKKTSEDAPVYPPARIHLQQTVTSDPAGKLTTTFYMEVLSATFKYDQWEEWMQEPPDYDIFDLIEAKATFSGYDPVANRDVSAVGKFQIQVGNLYDDLSRFGR
jgi:hypothetical protein